MTLDCMNYMKVYLKLPHKTICSQGVGIIDLDLREKYIYYKTYNKTIVYT